MQHKMQQQDPTAVVGRRVAAAIIDGALHFAVNAVIFFLLADSVGTLGRQLSGGKAFLYYVISLGLVGLHHGWLQGTKGYTLGKHAARIRVIGPDGNPPGVLRALLRTIMWIVDAAPWCLPGLLGFILVSTTRGHRRLGDMAADTYVVTEEYARVPQS